MKNPAIPFLILLLLCGACHKTRETAAPPDVISGTVLDALSRGIIPGCRVYLLDSKNHQVLAETLSDSAGHFVLQPMPSAPSPLLHVTHNAYAWKAPEPVQTDGQYWLKPYVPVQLLLKQEAPYQICQLTGSFNESGLYLPARAENHTTLTAEVFDTLTVRVSFKNGTNTRIKKEWIEAMNQKVDIP